MPRKQRKRTPLKDEDVIIFEVEKILGKKLDEKGVTKYLVKWVDFPDADNSWEPVECFDDKSLICDFEEKEKGRKKRTTRTSSRSDSEPTQPLNNRRKKAAVQVKIEEVVSTNSDRVTMIPKIKEEKEDEFRKKKGHEVRETIGREGKRKRLLVKEEEEEEDYGQFYVNHSHPLEDEKESVEKEMSTSKLDSSSQSSSFSSLLNKPKPSYNEKVDKWLTASKFKEIIDSSSSGQDSYLVRCFNGHIVLVEKMVILEKHPRLLLNYADKISSKSAKTNPTVSEFHVEVESSQSSPQKSDKTLESSPQSSPAKLDFVVKTEKFASEELFSSDLCSSQGIDSLDLFSSGDDFKVKDIFLEAAIDTDACSDSSLSVIELNDDD